MGTAQHHGSGIVRKPSAQSTVHDELSDADTSQHNVTDEAGVQCLAMGSAVIPLQPNYHRQSHHKQLQQLLTVLTLLMSPKHACCKWHWIQHGVDMRAVLPGQ